MSVSPTIFDCPPISYWKSNPYGLDFSPDGSMLAVGSGSWYCHGGVSLIDLSTGSESTIRFVWAGYKSEFGVDATDLPVADFYDGVLTISGVAFDASGDYLAVCGYGRRPAGSATFLLSTVDGELTHHETLEAGGLLTGLCFMDGQIFVRSHSARNRYKIFRGNELSGIDTSVQFAHRSHARIAVANNELITGSLRVARDPDAHDWHEDGLAVGPNMRSLASPGSKITAVLAHPDGRLITGGINGEIYQWDFDNEWEATRQLQGATERQVVKSYRQPGRGYRSESVVGLCALEDGRFFSVDASGRIDEWSVDKITATYTIPRPGTPRCIAVHPNTSDGPLLAVGVKALDSQSRPRPVGYVALFPITE